MAFDIGAGIYWRPEEGGLLWGMSNPAEVPGPGRAIDWTYLRRMERRLNTLLPATKGLGTKKAWSATIEYTPDHLPLLGALVATAPGGRRGGASACGRDDVGPGRRPDRGRSLESHGVIERRGHADGPLPRARQFAVRRPGGAAVPRSGGRLIPSWSTGQVRVRVMPSRSCIGITIPLAVEMRGSRRDDVVGTRHQVDGDAFDLTHHVVACAALPTSVWIRMLH
jgi:hypothetical protein